MALSVNQALIVRAGFDGAVSVVFAPGANHEGPSNPETPETVTLTFKNKATNAIVPSKDASGELTPMVFSVSNPNTAGNAITESIRISLVSSEVNSKRRLTAPDGTYVELDYFVYTDATTYSVHLTSATDALDIQDFTITDDFKMVKTGETGTYTSNIDLEESQVFVYDGQAAGVPSITAAIDLKSYLDGNYAGVGIHFSKLRLNAIESTTGNNTESITFSSRQPNDVFSLSLNSVFDGSGINHDDLFALNGYIEYNASQIWTDMETTGEDYSWSKVDSLFQTAFTTEVRSLLAVSRVKFNYSGDLKPREVVPSAGADAIEVVTTSDAAGSGNTIIKAKPMAPAVWSALAATQDTRAKAVGILYLASSQSDLESRIDDDFGTVTDVSGTNVGSVSNSRNSGTSGHLTTDTGLTNGVRLVETHDNSNNLVTFSVASSILYNLTSSANRRVFGALVSAIKSDDGKMYISNQSFVTSNVASPNELMSSMSITDGIQVFVYSTAGIVAAMNQIDGQIIADTPYSVYDSSSNLLYRRFQWKMLEDGLNATSFYNAVSTQGLRMGSTTPTFGSAGSANGLFYYAPVTNLNVSSTPLAAPVSHHNLKSGTTLNSTLPAGIINNDNDSFEVPDMDVKTFIASPALGAVHGSVNFQSTYDYSSLLSVSYIDSGHLVYAIPSEVKCVWSGVGYDGKAAVVFKIGDDKDAYWPRSEHGSLEIDYDNRQGATGISGEWTLESNEDGDLEADAMAQVPRSLQTGPFQQSYEDMSGSNLRFLVYTRDLSANTDYLAFTPYLYLNNMVKTATSGPANQNVQGENGTLRGNVNMDVGGDFDKTVVHYEKSALPPAGQTKYAAMDFLGANDNGVVIQGTRARVEPDDGFGIVLSTGALTQSVRDVSDVGLLSSDASAQYDIVAWDFSAAAAADTTANDYDDKVDFPLKTATTDVAPVSLISEDISCNAMIAIRNLLWKDGVQLTSGADALSYVIQYSENFIVTNNQREAFSANDVLKGDGNGLDIVGNSANPDHDGLLKIVLKDTLPAANGAGIVTNVAPSTQEKIIVWVYEVDNAGNAVEITTTPETKQSLLNGAVLASNIAGALDVLPAKTGYKRYKIMDTDASGGEILLAAPAGKDYKVAALRYSNDPLSGVVPEFYSPTLLSTESDSAYPATLGNRYSVPQELNGLLNGATDQTNIALKDVSEALSSSLNAVTSVAQLADVNLIMTNAPALVKFQVNTWGRPLASVFMIVDREDAFTSDNPDTNVRPSGVDVPEVQPVLKITYLPEVDGTVDPVPLYNNDTNNPTLLAGGLKDLVDSVRLVQAKNGTVEVLVRFNSTMGQMNGAAAVGVTNQGEMAIAFNQ